MYIICYFIGPISYAMRSSTDEIANVNFLYDDIVQVRNTINSAAGRRSYSQDRPITVFTVYVLERRFTKFSEVTQCNGHYAVEGHRVWYQLKAHIRLPTSD